jgi:hypothetical protein
VRQVNAKYQFFTDRFNGEEANEIIEFTNIYVDNLIGATNELDIELFLFNELDAQLIAERYALYNSLSQANITLRMKLDLALKNLNDKIYINLDRLYKRFGSGDRRKIGIINKIQRDGRDMRIEFNDLGNVFNRVPSIAPDDAEEFIDAEAEEKLFNGYVCDNDLGVPNPSSDKEIGTQIIG